MEEILNKLRQGPIVGAESLLGWELVHETAEGRTSGYIVETEAYHQDDPASHTYKGQTLRNSAMFGPAGTIYVYFTYGMHYCFNIVSGHKGRGEGVLIRALQPKEGIELMKQRRGRDNERELTNGPAKLVQAMGITSSMNGSRLGDSIYLLPGLHVARTDIIIGPRIGISKATEELARFAIKDNPFVSHPV